jgi:hypothetical protein
LIFALARDVADAAVAPKATLDRYSELAIASRAATQKTTLDRCFRIVVS